MASNLTVGFSSLGAYCGDDRERYGGSEIEEEIMSSDGRVELGTIREESERDGEGDGEDVVYVVVGGKQNDEMLSMDALHWTLLHQSSTLVFLVHVFPEVKYIPTPLGKMPISQVNPEQKENFLSQERGKRRDFLQKFLNVCSSSQVKVDTILIESEMEAKAILDLIPILNIKKLVVGAPKSSIRRIRSARKGNGVADQIVQSAPEYCEVKIICEGKEMSELELPSPSASPNPLHKVIDTTPRSAQGQEQTRTDTFACGCFKI